MRVACEDIEFHIEFMVFTQEIISLPKRTRIGETKTDVLVDM